jgi:tetratricopeptide (TPR) repeat protein
LLLNAEVDVISLLASTDEDVGSLRAQLRKDIEQARAVDEGMAEATLAEMEVEPDLDISRVVALADKAKDQDPDNPYVLGTRSETMLAAGRMNEAVNDADRAAQLDPLSPATRARLFYALLYGGRTERARDALSRAKRLWPDTQTIRDAEGALEFRYGDFERQILSSEGATPVGLAYIKARKDPSDANVGAFVTTVQRAGILSARAVLTLQALGEMRRVNEFFELAQEPKVAVGLAKNTYVLFRPWLANVRRDPRFMGVAKRVGLLDYWRSSGNWPDFCQDPQLPYDCKAEAAKYG